jgi:hypothetical protein
MACMNYTKGQAEAGYAGPLGGNALTKPPEPPGEVIQVTGQLRDRLDRIGYAIAELAERLKPVLSATVSETAPSPTGYAAVSPLGKQLEDLDNHARDLGDLLYSLRDRVQL